MLLVRIPTFSGLVQNPQKPMARGFGHRPQDKWLCSRLEHELEHLRFHHPPFRFIYNIIYIYIYIPNPQAATQPPDQRRTIFLAQPSEYYLLGVHKVWQRHTPHPPPPPPRPIRFWWPTPRINTAFPFSISYPLVEGRLAYPCPSCGIQCSSWKHSDVRSGMVSYQLVITRLYSQRGFSV